MPELTQTELLEELKQQAVKSRRELLEVHRKARETRVASSLSNVEIFVALYYGRILDYRPEEPRWDGRDRMIVSKGHGSISLYPILADLGFFPREELDRVCQAGSFLGGIPDPVIPGFETVNGSLGHGLGVSAGIALALKKAGKSQRVFTLIGDGELHEGSCWEAIHFAGHHGLDNLNYIIDKNGKTMLNHSEQVIDMDPLARKFENSGWAVRECDGHDVVAVYRALNEMKTEKRERPGVLIANTVKGKGVPSLENSPMCHILGVSDAELDELIGPA